MCSRLGEHDADHGQAQTGAEAAVGAFEGDLAVSMP